MSTKQEKPRKIVIFGAGRGAITAVRYFRADTPHEVVGHAVDADFLRTTEIEGRPVIAIEDLVRKFPPDDFYVFAPMGASRMNQVRSAKYVQLKSMGYRFVSYVHSSNDIHQKGTVGENCFILERQTTNYDCAIGNNVMMWSGCHIGDGSRIGDNCFLGSHVVVNGFVEVGASCYLASNCTLAHGVKVGASSFIGANALIAADTSERSVHVIEPTGPLEMDSLRFLRLLRHDV